jgi:hypothetical protein
MKIKQAQSHFLPVAIISFMLFFHTNSCRKNPVAPVEELPKKPDVHITAPIAGSLIAGPVLFTVATDPKDSMVAVDFLVDDTVIRRDTIPEFSIVWAAGFWADGLQHRLEVIATDSREDTVHAGPITVTVSENAQAVGILHPMGNQVVGAPFWVDLFVPEGTVVVSAEFQFDGLVLGSDTTAPFEQYVNPAFWADGLNHSIVVNLADSSGRTGKSGPVTFTVSPAATGYPLPISPASMLVVDNLQQTLYWNDAPTALSYEVEISPLPDFSTVEFASVVSDTSLTRTLAERSIYFWRVRATNAFQKQTHWKEAEFATTPTFRKIFATTDPVQARSVDVTTDGGYVLSTMSDAGVWVIKTDRFGVEQWSGNFGGGYNQSLCVRQTSDGGFVVAARMESQTEGRFAILKLTSGGTLSWLKRFGRDWDEGASSVIEMQDGSFIATGYVTVLPGFYTRAYLVKVSASGDSLWARTYNKSALTAGVKVLTTPDNGLIVLGPEFKLAGDTVSSMLPPDFWVLRTNADGDSLWSHIYGGANDDYPADIAETTGGFVVAGNTSPPSMGTHEMVLVKIDISGNELWTKTFGQAGKNDMAQAVISASGGGYLLAGFTGTNQQYSNDVYLIRTDELGEILWTKEFGTTTDDAIFSAKETPDGGFILAGAAGQDIQIIKTDKRGRVAGVVY